MSDAVLLDPYLAKLEAGIRDVFGDSLAWVGVSTPQADDPNGMLVDTPAVIIEVEQLNDAYADDLSDGRDAVVCSVGLYCVLGVKTPNLQQALWNFAAEMMRNLKNNRVGVISDGLAGRPESVSSHLGRMKLGDGGFDSRVVTFEQTVFLGEQSFPGIDIAPSQILWCSNYVDDGSYTRVV